MPVQLRMIAVASIFACNADKVEETDGTDTDPPVVTDTGDPLPTGPLAIVDEGAAPHVEYENILVAHWRQNADADVHVEFSFDPGVWVTTPTRALGAGRHEELLLGVPYATAVTWRIVASNATEGVTTPDLGAVTPPPPLDLPVGELLSSDPARYDPAAPWIFTSLAPPSVFGDEWWHVIVDRAGRIVWAQRTERGRAGMHPGVARDGRSLLVDQNSFFGVFDGGMKSAIEQTLIDGTIVRTIATPGMHHPFTELPDGTIAYGRTYWYYAEEELTLVRPDDATEVLWRCSDWLAEIGYDSYCMSNTLTYHEASDRFLFSMWTNETVIEIDGTTGASTRWFGSAPGSYAFDPPDSRFWWQHGAAITPTGTLLVSTDLTWGPYTGEGGTETVVREYAIDDASETLREVWNMDVGAGIYGHQMGEARRLPNGNTWHNFGEVARLREGTPDGAIVWDVRWPGAGAIGRSMPLTSLYDLSPPQP